MLQLHLPRHQHCADLQVARRALPPNPLEHLAPMLLPIFRQIEQKALVERAPRSFRRAARISKRVLPILGSTLSALRRHVLANSFKTSNAVVVSWPHLLDSLWL